AGLYGSDDLVSPETFEERRKQVEAQCRLLQDAARKSAPIRDAAQAQRLIRILDSISARLCVLLDTWEVCSSSHESMAVREAAQHSYSKLAKFVTRINMDESLWRPLDQIVNTEEIFSELSPEEQRVAVSLKLEFERDGIHLEESEKVVIEELQARLREVEVEFHRLDRQSAGSLVLTLKESGKLLMDAPTLGSFGKLKPRQIPPSYAVEVNSTTLHIVLRHVKNQDLRRRFYVAAHSFGVEHTLRVLQMLIDSRQELAEALGFASYAHLATSYRLTKSPQVVMEFLDALNGKISPRSREETSLLQALKQNYEGSVEALQSWDVPFYSARALKKRFGDRLEEASQYFTVRNCLSGLRLISNKLFGLQFESVPLDPGEQWAPGVEKLLVKEEDGSPAGVLYLDLYSRPGKYENPAHFQVQSSHLHRPLTELVDSEHLAASGVADSGPDSDRHYNLPSSVLVCNFERGGVLLHHSQVQTLFHEFGHALHSLLSRTEFQHLSGTRGELDFVETPSQLMEYFTFDERVLKQFAFHHKTNKPIPSEVVDALVGAKAKLQAMELQQQIMFAACDQVLFGGKDSIVLQDRHAMAAVLRELHNKYSHVPHVDGTLWISRFSHFINYGAAYYSYTYAKGL
ncbi:Mitochondrial intermediate peptidase, partial [Durusdinium trenchii]